MMSANNDNDTTHNFPLNWYISNRLAVGRQHTHIQPFGHTTCSALELHTILYGTTKQTKRQGNSHHNDECVAACGILSWHYPMLHSLWARQNVRACLPACIFAKLYCVLSSLSPPSRDLLHNRRHTILYTLYTCNVCVTYERSTSVRSRRRWGERAAASFRQPQPAARPQRSPCV